MATGLKPRRFLHRDGSRVSVTRCYTPPWSCSQPLPTCSENKPFKVPVTGCMGFTPYLIPTYTLYNGALFDLHALH
jgi:hypothetical protein